MNSCSCPTLLKPNKEFKPYFNNYACVDYVFSDRLRNYLWQEKRDVWPCKIVDAANPKPNCKLEHASPPRGNVSLVNKAIRRCTKSPVRGKRQSDFD